MIGTEKRIQIAYSTESSCIVLYGNIVKDYPWLVEECKRIFDDKLKALKKNIKQSKGKTLDTYSSSVEFYPCKKESKSALVFELKISESSQAGGLSTKEIKGLLTDVRETTIKSIEGYNNALRR